MPKEKTKFQKRVLISKVPDIANAYISISAQKRKLDGLDFPIVKLMSFCYIPENHPDIMIEWEPEYGPITILERCSEDWKDEYNSAKPHWYFDFYKGQGNWSQMAVDDYHLKESFVAGDYEHIFAKLAAYV